MKILVAGSNGFIGSFLCKSLMKDGISVRGFDSQCNQGQPGSFECFTGDIRHRDIVSKAVKSIDVVVHLIAMHHDFGISESEYFDVNEKGTQNLLTCCSEAGIKKFIFFSSVAVYGTQTKPTNENTTPNPDTPYGSSKLAAEKVVMQWFKADPTRQIVIIRPTVVFGPKNYANVYNLINQVCNRKFFFVSDGSNIKSVAYVENLVEATIFLLQRMKPGIEIYNYSDEPQMTTKQIVETIAHYAKVPLPKIRIPFSIALAFGSIFDILAKLTGYNFPVTGNRIRKFCTATHHKADKIRSSDFRPSVSLDEGFGRTINWYLEQRAEN